MDPMTIALIVLVIAGVWAVVELALTLRQTRKSVSELSDSVNDTIGEVRPAIDELGPAVKEVAPILEKASTTVDLINVDLVRVEGILSDVNAVTGAGAHVTDAVTGAAESVSRGVAGVAAKVAGKVTGAGKAAKIAAPETAANLEAPKDEAGEPTPEADVEVERVKGDTGYFTYPGASAQAEGDAATTDGSAE